MAFDTFTVNGPAITQFGIASSLNRLGISEDGVTVTPELLREQVFSDYYGTQIPADIQLMGVIARITFSLVQWEESILNQVRGGMRGRTAGQLLAADIGALLLQGTLYNELYIESSVRTGGTVPDPWRFQRIIAMDSLPIKLGTTVSRQQCSFLALPHNGYCWIRS